MRIPRFIFQPATVAGAIALAAPSAFGQAFDAVRLFGAAPGQDAGRIGLAAVAGPTYAGSQNRRVRAFPVFDYQWSNGWFAGITNGIGYNFSDTPRMQYGLRLAADLGRKERRDAALRGLGDIDAAATAGAFFNYVLPAGFFLTSSLRHGSGNDRDGTALDPAKWRSSSSSATTPAPSSVTATTWSTKTTR